MHRKIILFEKIFTVISFVHYSGGPLLLFLSGAMSEGDEGEEISSFALINGIFLLIYAITFVLLAIRWRKVISVISKSGLVWLLFGLAIFSWFWSYSPDLTRVRLVALIGTMMFSLYIASRYTLKEQLQLFGWIFGTIIVLTILFAVLLPKYGLMGGVHHGAWRGIYNHKNGLGRIMVPSAIVFCLLALSAQRQRWIYWSLLSASVMLILFSRASSPLINLIILMSLLSILPILRWNLMFLVPISIGISSIGIILYLIFTSNAEILAGAFGKDLTLTGRTNFWPLMIDKIWESPWLGYGYGAFWQGLDGPSAYVWNASTFKAPNGHNGYLDICVQLGFVGLISYALIFITSFQKALAYVRRAKTADVFWPTLLLSYIILSNLTETSLVLQNNSLWIMELAMFFSLSIPQLTAKKEPILQEM
jgi:exopolysaccharide production protein ExoQ